MMVRQLRGRISVLGPPITVGVVGLLLWEAFVRGFGIRAVSYTHLTLPTILLV